MKRKQPFALQHRDYLTLLSKSKGATRRRKLIDAGDNDQIRAVSECVQNVVKGNLPLSKSQLRKLKKHQTVLRAVTSSVRAPSKSKRILKQSGGFLNFLLPIALNALSGLFGATK
jgi:hypothetical protein